MKQYAELFTNVQPVLDSTVEKVAEEVRQNIRNKNIIDTGALLDSIEAETGKMPARVRDGVPYGVYNEFGTYKMAARPFFIPAVEKGGEIMEQAFWEVFKL